MLGITKRSRNPDLAWDLAMHLYLNKPETAKRFADTNILPPARDSWNHPAYRQPRPYWSGQPLGSLYAALAPHVPFQYQPARRHRQAEVQRSARRLRPVHNTRGEKGFEPYVRARLKQSADEVRHYESRRNPY